ncbi:MAG: hypothetical protein USCGTAYLOR_00389 [Chromatiales bacterium USCg_Taylor]|nr:MAG: hypothetical protein USCGTAYLOR_00389 [Chromatiales bacterium USCg_Taylor]
MLYAAKTFVDTLAGITRLEKGPQHLPTSYALLITSVVVYTLTRFGVYIYKVPIGSAAIMGLADTAITVGIIVLLLAVRGVTFRAPQMLTAFTSIASGFGWAIILSLGLISMIPDVPMVQGFRNVVIFPLVLVNVVITGHLFRASLGTNLAAGVGIALVLLFIVTNVTDRFDPTLERTGAGSSRMTPSPQTIPER